MPWKGEKDPYKIWLSEIILQQTRVDQGLAYYHRFINKYPDIKSLARAPDEKVFKLWEGLGYYTRCRNLIATARFIAKDLNGKFPESYETIRSLKGIGPYTAAAISSFAFNLPFAVVDGNVFRVLARISGVSIPVDSTTGKKYFTSLAEELLDKKQPGIYNQAIMDFGAVICKPVAPLCSQCPFRKYCFAFLNNKVNVLPVKEKKISIRKRWFYYFVMEHKGEIVLHHRSGKDIWQGLYEFPLIESGKELNKPALLRLLKKKKWFSDKTGSITGISPVSKQQLSHQLIVGQFINLQMKQRPKLGEEWFWIKKEKAKKYPFPGFINQYLDRSV